MIDASSSSIPSKNTTRCRKQTRVGALGVEEATSRGEGTGSTVQYSISSSFECKATCGSLGVARPQPIPTEVGEGYGCKAGAAWSTDQLTETDGTDTHD